MILFVIHKKGKLNHSRGAEPRRRKRWGEGEWVSPPHSPAGAFLARGETRLSVKQEEGGGSEVYLDSTFWLDSHLNNSDWTKLLDA